MSGSVGPQFDQAAVPWWGLPSSNGDEPVAAPPVSHFPLPGWPAQPTVEYLTKLIALGLLLLAVPYLLGRLLLSPVELVAEIGAARAVPGASV